MNRGQVLDPGAFSVRTQSRVNSQPDLFIRQVCQVWRFLFMAATARQKWGRLI